MKKGGFNIMTNVKIIETLKAQLICIVGEFYKLLTKGTNTAHGAILECIAQIILIMYILADRLGYSFKEVDDELQEKLDLGIREEDEIEKDNRSLSNLKKYINNRMD